MTPEAAILICQYNMTFLSYYVLVPGAQVYCSCLAAVICHLVIVIPSNSSTRVMLHLQQIPFQIRLMLNLHVKLFKIN